MAPAMDRPIAYDKLAREDRFVRMRTRDVPGRVGAGSARTIRFDDGSSVSGRAVILATGVIYRQLPAQGCDQRGGTGFGHGDRNVEITADRGHLGAGEDGRVTRGQGVLQIGDVQVRVIRGCRERAGCE